ncbi:hypothetical protein GOBAR_AA09264 [Gossypium barbadense]|uniref:Inositol-tetrakisphosphate 1-kinase n=1 Tax=Gossypium barbadense TaxID=3634 RepID=A0A2P5Y732_GOSBA|nr:hypothetical protein GOBAR_AA09264 [Gossypium barbadense]
MRIKGKNFDGEGGEEEEQKLVVGYALTLKKKKSFLQPEFERLACKKGILFVAIDVNLPLSDQGPFDIILHKLLGKEWGDIVEDYRQTHPEVIVIDPPYAIQHLHNRQSMLQDVVDLNLSDFHGRVGVPKQMVIMKDPLSIPDEVAKAGLKLPLAKPLVVDGSAKSHELFLACDWSSLSELEPPLVLQEFVNHDGILFKIYIVGDAIKVVRRFSLSNVNQCQLAKVPGIFPFPRVSSAAASADDADLDPRIADMIREHGTRDIFYVIDINYFPGYGKMPDYEVIFTDFLLTFKKK